MVQNKDFLGTGLKFPVTLNNVTGRFEMVSGDENIKESIYVILMTQKGERLLMPNFGSRINDYVFEVMSETNLTLMANNVKTAIEIYEKRIKDIKVDISREYLGQGKLVLNISYVVATTNEIGNLVFPFYIQDRDD